MSSVSLVGAALAADLQTTPPPGWLARDLAIPAPQTGNARLVRAEAWVDANGSASLSIACHEAPLDGYSNEADEFVRDRLVGVASSLADRAFASGPVHVTSTTHEGDVTVLECDGPRARARGAWGFERDPGGSARGDHHDQRGTRLVSCVGVCAWREHEVPACTDALSRARLVGALGPAPGPTVAMRLLGVAMRNPTGTAAALAIAACLAGVLAIVTRRRPKT